MLINRYQKNKNNAYHYVMSTSLLLSICIKCKSMGPAVVGAVFISGNSISSWRIRIGDRKWNSVWTLGIKGPEAEFECPWASRFVQLRWKSISVRSRCKENRITGCSRFSSRICMKCVLVLPSKTRCSVVVNFPSVWISCHRYSESYNIIGLIF